MCVPIFLSRNTNFSFLTSLTPVIDHEKIFTSGSTTLAIGKTGNEVFLSGSVELLITAQQVLVAFDESQWPTSLSQWIAILTSTFSYLKWFQFVGPAPAEWVPSYGLFRCAIFTSNHLTFCFIRAAAINVSPTFEVWLAFLL